MAAPLAADPATIAERVGDNRHKILIPIMANGKRKLVMTLITGIDRNLLSHDKRHIRNESQLLHNLLIIQKAVKPNADYTPIAKLR